jgi:hypothetical protein
MVVMVLFVKIVWLIKFRMKLHLFRRDLQDYQDYLGLV